MPGQLMTFRHTAEVFCSLDKRPESDVQSVYLQIKGLHDRGLLKAADVRAARGANQLSFKEICRARLLLVLVDLGIESEDLRRAADQLDKGKVETLPDGSVARSNLDAAIANDSWLLEVRMVREYAMAGRPRFDVQFRPNPTDFDADPSAATLLAQVGIPASKLIQSIRTASNA